MTCTTIYPVVRTHQSGTMCNCVSIVRPIRNSNKKMQDVVSGDNCHQNQLPAGPPGGRYPPPLPPPGGNSCNREVAAASATEN